MPGQINTIGSLAMVCQIALLVLSGCGDPVTQYGNFETPGLEPQLFGPDLVSQADRHEFGSIISKSGREIYFGIDIDGRSEILFTEYDNGSWSNPEPILSHGEIGYNDPMLTEDESRLFFISNYTPEGIRSDDIDIWFVEKTSSGWGDPLNAGGNINSHRNEYYMSFTSTGAMYFSSNINADSIQPYNFDIYKSDFRQGSFQPPVRLPETINTSRYEADVFIAPDENYIIFCSTRDDGLGRGDLYISFATEDNSWTEAVNMGSPINDEFHQLCPFVTQDGRFLLYTSNQDIYWVSADILERYR